MQSTLTKSEAAAINEQDRRNTNLEPILQFLLAGPALVVWLALTIDLDRHLWSWLGALSGVAGLFLSYIKVLRTSSLQRRSLLVLLVLLLIGIFTYTYLLVINLSSLRSATPHPLWLAILFLYIFSLVSAIAIGCNQCIRILNAEHWNSSDQDNAHQSRSPDLNAIPNRYEYSITQKFARRTLTYGLGLGILGDLLFYGVQRPGLPITLWLIGFAVLALALTARTRPDKLKLITRWSLLAIAASAVLIVRLNPVSLITMLAIIFLSAVVVAIDLRGINLRECSVHAFVMSCLRLPLQALSGSIALLGKVDVSSGLGHPSTLPIVRGLLLSLPLLFLFGGLFSSADAGFESFFTSVIEYFGPALPEHLLLCSLIGWLAAGMLTSISSIDMASENKSSLRIRLGGIESTVVMSSLLALFLLFVLLQLPYLFGGAETIANTTDLTLADYARRGFFELMAVTLLTLVTLIALRGVSNSNAHFRYLATALLLCLLLIMLSAFQRLFLYMDGFGLTLSRLVAAVFMLWLGFCMAVFARCVWRDRDRGFVPSAVYSAIIVAFALSLFSPSKFVAQYNIAHAQESDSSLDVIYLSSLGAEVIPLLLENFDSFDSRQQCMLVMQWTDQFQLEDAESELSDWRNWNLAYSRSRSALLEKKPDFPAIVDRTEVRFMPRAFPAMRHACLQDVIHLF